MSERTKSSSHSKKTVLKIAVGVIAAAAVFTAGHFGLKALASNRSKSLFDELYGVYQASLYVEQNAVAELNDPTSDFPSGWLERFRDLYAKNSDIIGWLSAGGLNLPVVKTDNNEYYTSHNFLKESSSYGTPFLDCNSSLEKTQNSKNLIVWLEGDSGAALSIELRKYLDTAYYRKNPTIEFNTVTEAAGWKVIAAFINADGQDDAFDYYNYHSFLNEEELAFYISNVRKRSAFDTRVNVTFSDELLTVSAPASDFDGARIVVVARKIREDETENDEAQSAVPNQYILQPDEWYRIYGGQKPSEDKMLNAEQVMTDLPGQGGSDDSFMQHPDVSDTSSDSSGDESSQTSSEDSSVTSSENSSKENSSKANSSKENSSKENSSKDTSSNTSSQNTSSAKPPVSSNTSSQNTSSVKPPVSSNTSSQNTSSAKPPVSSNTSSQNTSSIKPPVSSNTSSQVTSSAKPPVSSADSSANTSSDYTSSEDSTETSSGSTSSEDSTVTSSESASSEVTSSDITSSDTSSTPSSGGLAIQLVSVSYGGATVTDTAYNIVCRIVANEMNSSCPDEAIKAQAVAAHTFVVFHNNINWIPSVGLKTPNERIKKLVKEVIDELIYYNGAPIYAAYFSTSAGYTNTAQEVWGGAGYPYIQMVESKYDYLVPNYRVVKQYTYQYIRDVVRQQLGISLTGDPTNWFEVVLKTNAGYNSLVSVGGQTTYTTSSGQTAKITGTLIRSMFGLRSTYFDIEYKNDSGQIFEITTCGYGHGVGMSQYGAIKYAEIEGWSYKQILNHYYTDVEVR